MPLKIREKVRSYLPHMKKKTPVIKYAEIEDLDLNIIRYRPPAPDELAKKVNFSKRELQIMYRGFKQECPTGLIDKENFRTIYCQFFPQGDASKYAECVFQSFNKSSSGSLSFEEIVQQVSTLSRGTVAEKLDWIFRLYDADAEGHVTMDSMERLVRAVYEMIGRHTVPAVTEDAWRQHAETAFMKLDLNHDGVISKDEFIEYCTQDPTIVQAFENLNTIF